MRGRLIVARAFAVVVAVVVVLAVVVVALSVALAVAVLCSTDWLRQKFVANAGNGRSARSHLQTNTHIHTQRHR